MSKLHKLLVFSSALTVLVALLSNAIYIDSNQNNLKDLSTHFSAQSDIQISNMMVMDDCTNPFGGVMGSYNRFDECGNPGTFTLSANVGANTDIIINFPTPNGFVFKGNVTGGTLLGTDPVISISPDLNGLGIEITFDLQAQCGTGDGEVVEFTVDYIDSVDEAQQCTYNSPPLTVLDIFVTIPPEGTPGRSTENSIVSVLNETDTLISEVVQEGVGEIDDIFYYVGLAENLVRSLVINNLR